MKFILLVIAVLLGFRILQGLVMMFEQKIGGSIIVMAFLVEMVNRIPWVMINRNPIGMVNRIPISKELLYSFKKLYRRGNDKRKNV